MFILQVLCFIVWLYILWVCDRAKLKFHKFVIGSVGAFVFMLIWIQKLVTAPLTKFVAYVAGVVGELTGMYDSYYEYSMLFIPKNTAAVSLCVDFECSGVIEMMAFLALLWFFDVYSKKEKIKYSLMGIVFIFGANVIRIFTICFIIYFGGNNWFYFAHSIFGRLIFYVLTVILYFDVFTKAQIKRQKIGSFSYEEEKNE
ncbi:MAG: exosortase family protein XrtG [Lachnospiraceae bacterium]|nr:exosortase family protein XrtG [Lachnospiraceae bacterium]